VYPLTVEANLCALLIGFPKITISDNSVYQTACAPKKIKRYTRRKTRGFCVISNGANWRVTIKLRPNERIITNGSDRKLIDQHISIENFPIKNTPIATRSRGNMERLDTPVSVHLALKTTPLITNTIIIFKTKSMI
jgi:hypothetical protein